MDEVTEEDLALLESYLDESLSHWEAEQVRSRLSSEPAFSAALQQVRTERETRGAAWMAIGADTVDAQAFANSVLSRVRAFDRWKRFKRFGIVAGGAAACFAAGWGGHLLLPAQAGAGGPPIIAKHATSTVGSDAQLVSNSDGPSAFQVILTDQAGKVLAIQKFTKLDEARQFANELSRFRAQQEHVRQGQMVLISDEF